MKKTVVALAVPLVFGLAACGGNGSSSSASGANSVPPTSAAPASSAPASNAPASGAPVAGTGDRKDLPANFPLPPGSKITASVKAANGISVVMLLANGADGAAFWEKELPAAGYSIVQTLPATDHTLIRFSGNGYSHCSIAVGGNAAHLAMTQ